MRCHTFDELEVISDHRSDLSYQDRVRSRDTCCSIMQHEIHGNCKAVSVKTYLSRLQGQGEGVSPGSKHRMDEVTPWSRR